MLRKKGTRNSCASRCQDPVEAPNADDSKDIDQGGGEGKHPSRSQAGIEQAISTGVHKSPGEEKPKTQEDGIRNSGGIRRNGLIGSRLIENPEQHIGGCGAAEISGCIGVLARLPLQEEKAEAEPDLIDGSLRQTVTVLV
jgi:hypothetical protein